jgi:nicotinamide riboside kinase
MLHKMFTVVVTGPESTGKTEICKFLAGLYETEFIPEYARDYLSSLDRSYHFDDVEHIARVQVEQFAQYRDGHWPILFLDTYLVVWIDENLATAGIDLFLLCYPDIEWIPDPLRENPDPRRAFLYQAYVGEIKQLDKPFEVVRGSGDERFSNAARAVAKHFPILKDKP